MNIANIAIKPILYQHLTDIIFKRLLHNYLKVLHVDEAHIQKQRKLFYGILLDTFAGN